MPRDFPDRIDPWKAAAGRQQYAGTIPFGRLPRLMDLLVAEALTGDETAAFRVRFGHDEEGRPEIRLDVDASLPLTCQRSLETFELAVERRARLTVVRDLGELSLLGESADAVVAEDGQVWMRDLVEDELLLGVPEYPVDPQRPPVEFDTAGAGTDDGGADDGDDERQHPFADLKDMLQQRSD